MLLHAACAAPLPWFQWLSGKTSIQKVLGLNSRFFSVDLISLCLSALLSHDRHPIACYACGVRLNKLKLGGGSGDKINERRQSTWSSNLSRQLMHVCLYLLVGAICNVDPWWTLLRPFLWSTCLVYTPAIAGDSNMYSDFVIYRCYSCNFSGRLGVDIVICLHTLVCEPGLKLIPVACFKPCLLKLLAAKSNSYCSTSCYRSEWHSWCKPHFPSSWLQAKLLTMTTMQ